MWGPTKRLKQGPAPNMHRGKQGLRQSRPPLSNPIMPKSWSNYWGLNYGTVHSEKALVKKVFPPKWAGSVPEGRQRICLLGFWRAKMKDFHLRASCWGPQKLSASESGSGEYLRDKLCLLRSPVLWRCFMLPQFLALLSGACRKRQRRGIISLGSYRLREAR